MSKVTAKFKLKLEANGSIIAESEDTELCLRVLDAISKNEQFNNPENKNMAISSDNIPDIGSVGLKGSILEMAKKIKVDKDDLIGACDPKMETPYLTLEATYWESLQKNTGARGRSAVSPIVLALTLLNIWFDAAKLGKPTQKMAQEVLKTLHVSDKNASRAVKKCQWLQQKPDRSVTLNPAKYSLAIELARKYVTQTNE